MKLIDAVVPPAELIASAKAWIKTVGKAKAPWDEEGFQLPGGAVYSKAGMAMFPAANAIYRRETFDNYPAARAIMQVVYEGLQLPMDLALRVESRWFAKILRSPRSGRDDPHPVRLDAGAQQGRAPAGERAARHAQEDRHPRRGLHGRRHRLCHRAGRPRRGADRPRPGSADKGKAHSDKLIGRSGQQGPRQRPPSATALLARITPTADYGALKGCDLVIEAVFEDRKVKAEAIAKAEAVIGQSAVFGSNTSTLPITSLAAAVASGRRISSACISSRRSSA